MTRRTAPPSARYSDPHRHARRRTDPAELHRQLFDYLGVEDNDQASTSGVRATRTHAAFSSKPEALELLDATS